MPPLLAAVLSESLRQIEAATRGASACAAHRAAAQRAGRPDAGHLMDSATPIQPLVMGANDAAL